MILIWSHCHCYYFYHFCFYIPHSISLPILSFYILKSCWLICWTYLCLQILQSLLIDLFLLYYHGLRSPTYFLELFCQFSVVVSMICLLDLHDLSLQMLLHADSSVHCLNFTPSSMYNLKCSWAHTLIMSLCGLFFYQYWAEWQNMVCCLVMLWTYSAFAIFCSFQYFSYVVLGLQCLILCSLLFHLLLLQISP